MTNSQSKNIHWAYYTALESDIGRLSRFIDFDEQNYSTFSIELAHLLLSTGSEVDVLLRELCRLTDPSCAAKNIQNYKDVMLSHLPGLVDQQVVCRKHGLSLTPWSGWQGDSHPGWWRSYNKVKHERSKAFSEANLINCLNAIAGLYLINIHYNHSLHQQDTGFPLDLANTLPYLHLESDLLRIDDPFAYMRD